MLNIANIRKSWSKSTLNIASQSVRMATIKKKKATNVGEDVKVRKPPLVVGVVGGNKYLYSYYRKQKGGSFKN